MQCENIKCPYYRKPDKLDFVDRMFGITRKKGGCAFGWCKLKTKNQTHK